MSLPMKQTLTILGSTGSIGANTLDVVARHPDLFSVFALTAAVQVDTMLAQCQRFLPRFAVMSSVPHAAQLREKVRELGLPIEVLSGPAALDQVASAPEVTTVMASIVGAAGLSSCLSAARAGKRLLLANKEALVVGAEVFLTAVREGGATLLPIDSEHSAIFQSLPEDARTWDARVEKIILTSSGGPFRQRPVHELPSVTPDQACAHPNWLMGRKISVDSATMMNKALEVIEARYLFGLVPERIEVVIHPQSIVHSMVQYRDTSVVAQLGTPDMRVPIAFGLGWPERIASGAQALDFQTLSAMTFEAIDSLDHPKRFPGLWLSWHVLRAAPGTTAVLNAANEVGVDAFLNGRIRFDQIHHLNLETLSACLPSAPANLEDVLSIDQQARRTALGLCQRWHA
jgi:1-deoxy-D-xylulose-5-phosphate reductoisomerase